MIKIVFEKTTNSPLVECGFKGRVMFIKKSDNHKVGFMDLGNCNPASPFWPDYICNADAMVSAISDAIKSGESVKIDFS